MNLRDLERATQAVSGNCPGQCGDCAYCRTWALVEMAWKAGRRSGAQTAIDRDEAQMPWSDWKWTAAAKNELVRYGAERDFSASEVAVEFEAAKQWAESKNAQRPNWMAFMKAWLINERKRNPVAPAQGGLFESDSKRGGGVQDRRERMRSEVALSLVKGVKG